jgi:hypothetical protein
LLADLGAQLAEVLPPDSPEGGEVAARLDRGGLVESLGGGSGGTDVPALLGLLEWAGGLVTRLGAPARDAAAAAAAAAVRGQLAAGSGEAAATAAAATRALRLLSVQLKLLRLDTGEPLALVLSLFFTLCWLRSFDWQEGLGPWAAVLSPGQHVSACMLPPLPGNTPTSPPHTLPFCCSQRTLAPAVIPAGRRRRCRLRRRSA